MHKAYQPLRPTANKYLQKKWDQEHYDKHRKKVTEAKPIVDTKGIRTPTHIQVKLKKVQVEKERQAVIDRDNQLLASKLADIQLSKGRIDHRNFYPERSLNAERRRTKLLEVAHENQAIYERITAQESEYRRELWEEDWVRTEQRREIITRYPHGVAHKQMKKKSVKFFGGTSGQALRSSSRTRDGETTDEDLRHQ
ncbi:sperm axonemal maintenance protein CFAP97D1 isoform X2 [Tachysurus fulvidraco]|uniref:sperm axonemal maintenance protein CFAP97D1 isoform X2 n=1 Tax=Tachysurus fulvidraco TaxID=1234273 RepID=UPI000F503D2C|nr:sperm axonemal maintenance protein CFAP97D1 isoform X2 [Tachysurus fulvidraco]